MLSHCKYLLFFSFLLINTEKTMFAALPPAYLKELNIEEKAVSQEESDKAFKQIKPSALSAIRSLKNGGFIYVVNEANKIALRTLRSDGSAKFLAFANMTPQETQFYIIKSKNNPGIIWIKSPLVEGKVLADGKLSGIYLNTFNPNDGSQQWVLESADGLNQVYFKNKQTQKYLSIENSDESDEKATAIISNRGLQSSLSEQSRDGLFKIVILN